MDMKKIGVLAMMLVLMGGLVGCGTKAGSDLDRRARHYSRNGGLLGGTVGAVVGLGVAGVVTAVDVVTPDSTSSLGGIGGDEKTDTTARAGID